MVETNQCYLLRKIATTIDSNLDDDPRCFCYRNHNFIKQADFDIDTLVQDINFNRDFNLKIIEDCNKTGRKALYIIFLGDRRHRVQWESRIRILNISFNNINDIPFMELCIPQEENMCVTKCFYITSNLYELLREVHNKEKLPSEGLKCIQHELLKPKLRPYQSKAVQWLIHRETFIENIPDLYHQIRCNESLDRNFYINIADLNILDYNPGTISFPTGGILADEMGLGKTVEMLALILHNKRTLPEQDIYPIHTEKRIRRGGKAEEIYCTCVTKRKGKTVTCVECGALQHTRCVRKYAKSSDLEHLCPCCWETKGLIESSATIIVAPHSIKMQWYSEIQRHVNASIKILLYEGISQMMWISPKELAEYDIVITDYNILSKEIYFSTSNKPTCSFRKPRSYMRVISPLTMIRWWRVCLDEAQMVENSSTKISLMVKTLPTIHRWAVTGTPIQKSVDDLRGLLEFLDVIPYYGKNIFGRLVSLFQEGDTKPLLDLLKMTMWRTCKSTVLDELGIPPQSEEVHYMCLSDVEKLFYQSQHTECAAAFEEKVKKLAAYSTPFAKMNPRILKLLLDPLRRLRQYCTVPMLFQKSEQCVLRKVLQPEELLEHLKSTNEYECKSQLRTIASCYNGMAALHFIRGEIPQAIKHYEAVLRRAKDYQGPVSVDSLLQIHALHNIIIAHEMTENSSDALSQQLNEYKEQYTKLEWKYIETYYNNLQKVEHSYMAIYKEVTEGTTKVLNRPEGNWWRHVLYAFDIIDCMDHLIARINEEKNSTYSTSLYNNLTSSYGIDYLLTTWFDKVLKSRVEVLEEFEYFKQFTNNVKPKIELSKEEMEEINLFVKRTFKCHLEKNLKKEPENKKKKLCTLCKAKKILSGYECLIFDKILDEKTENTEGTWKAKLQEAIMKIICQVARAKHIDEELIKEGEDYLRLIDCIKKEYKELSKLWIETEYTVKAYDELNMCKIRLQIAANPEELEKKENKFIYIILKEEIDDHFMELTAQLESAEMEFVRKTARLKYIKHLESNSDPDVCPICNHKPESKYTVLECGHHLCLECFAAIRKYQKNTLTCSVCRNQQKYENIFFVTCKPSNGKSDEIRIKGHYSTKVEEVIRAVLKLKQKENDVKILIFSHWEAVLNLIGNALAENDVSLKLLACNPKKAIAEFKDEESKITCLLLLLAQGSKGLNLIEATHVFLVEPILNPGEEQQAIGRVHRIGQIRPTTVHRFICKNTIEEQIFDTVSKDTTKKWQLNDITIDNIRVLFSTDNK